MTTRGCQMAWEGNLRRNDCSSEKRIDWSAVQVHAEATYTAEPTGRESDVKVPAVLEATIDVTTNKKRGRAGTFSVRCWHKSWNRSLPPRCEIVRAAGRR